MEHYLRHVAGIMPLMFQSNPVKWCVCHPHFSDEETQSVAFRLVSSRARIMGSDKSGFKAAASTMVVSSLVMG